MGILLVFKPSEMSGLDWVGTESAPSRGGQMKTTLPDQPTIESFMIMPMCNRNIYSGIMIFRTSKGGKDWVEKLDRSRLVFGCKKENNFWLKWLRGLKKWGLEKSGFHCIMKLFFIHMHWQNGLIYFANYPLPPKQTAVFLNLVKKGTLPVYNIPLESHWSAYSRTDIRSYEEDRQAFWEKLL